MVTGGAGFIGSAVIRRLVADGYGKIVNVDLLTYAGNLESLIEESKYPGYVFEKADIRDSALMDELITRYEPNAIMHLAAESHVDRSIHGSEEFIQTNVVGTFHLLESTRAYWNNLSTVDKQGFRFLQVSTDEVYGSLAPDSPAFTETNRYKPSSPYSASKASSDHLVRAYHLTYGLPVLTTNCSNNYGPYQFPEKLIPLVIHNALSGKDIPIYGDGQQIRDWLYVGDHCSAIRRVLALGTPGDIYNIGGLNEKTNLTIVNLICDLLDQAKPRVDGASYRSQISYVEDRAGHDRRYAIDATKIERELNWSPAETFETGIQKTLQWYLDQQEWVNSVTSGAYRDWIRKQYA